VKNAGSTQIAADDLDALAGRRFGRPKGPEKKFYPVPGGTKRSQPVRSGTTGLLPRLRSVERG